MLRRTLRKRVLVTGGAGFIGSHLCARLLESGYEVLCVDNFFTGSRENLLHLLDCPRFEVMRHDITFPLYVETDEIYNLACPASPVHYQFDPVQTTKVSVSGTINMLGLAKRTGARLVHASTSEVYGDPEVHPQHEEYVGRVNPIGARACYDEGKRCAETLCFDYLRAHGMQARVARIFNTYGPNMQPNDGRVISNFIVQALHGEAITIYGDGTQSRSFCYVGDLVDALVRLMEYEGELPGPVNLGNPEEYTIRNVGQRVLELVGGDSELAFHPLPEDDPRRRQPSVERAQRLLDWYPATGLDAGLPRTVEYFRALKDAGLTRG